MRQQVKKINKSKKKCEKWSLLSAFLIILFLLIPNLKTALSAAPAEQDITSDLKIEKIKKVNPDLSEADISKGDKIKLTDQISLCYAWNLSGLSLTSDCTYKFNLPDELDVTSLSQDITSYIYGNPTVIGKMTITDNKGEIVFLSDPTIEQLFETTSQYDAKTNPTWARFELSAISFKSSLKDNPTLPSIKLGDFDLTIDRIAEANLTNKGVNSGDYSVDWTQELIATNQTTYDFFTNVTLTATIQPGHKYIPNSGYITVLRGISEIDRIEDSTHEIEHLLVSDNALSYTYPNNLAKGDKLVLHYKTRPEFSNFDRTKTDTVRYTTVADAAFTYNTDQNAKCSEVMATVNVPYTQSSFYQYYDVDPIASNIIHWTLSYFPEYMNYKKYPDFISILNNVGNLGLEYDYSSLKVKNSNDTLIDYLPETSSDKTSLLLTLKDIKPTKYSITFDTKVVDSTVWDPSQSLPNNQALLYTRSFYSFARQGNGTSDILQTFNMIELYPADTYNFTDHTIKWQAIVNPEEFNFNGGFVYLTIPADQEFVKAFDSNDKPIDAEILDTISPDGSKLVKIKVDSSILNDSRSATFNISTKIIDEDYFRHNRSKTFKLEAKLDGTVEMGGVFVDIKDKSETAKAQQSLTNRYINKTATKVSKARIKWRVVINLPNVALSPRSFIDTLQKGLWLDEDSVELYEASTTASGTLSNTKLADETQYSINYDTITQTLKLDFPNGLDHVYILEYQTGNSNDDDNDKSRPYTNTLYQEGTSPDNPESSSQATITTTLTTGKFDIDFHYATLNLHKYFLNSNNVSKPLANVHFQLYRIKVVNGKEKYVLPKDFPPTDSDGNTSLDFLSYGEYLLREVSAPDGFICAEDQKITINGSTVIDGVYKETIQILNEKIPTSSVPPQPEVIPATSITPSPTNTAIVPKPTKTPKPEKSSTPAKTPKPTKTPKPAKTPKPEKSSTSEDTQADKKNDVTITIVDGGTGNHIPHASVIIKNEKTGDTYTGKTNSKGELQKSIPYGKYNIFVVDAPNGYHAQSNVSVTVDRKNRSAVNVTVSADSNDATPADELNSSPKTGEQATLLILLMVAFLSGGLILFLKKKKYL